VLPFKDLGGFLESSDGHGIFIECDGFQMNVGAILPQTDGKYLLNVMIVAAMQVSRYKPCDFTGTYDSIEGATDSAQRVLTSHQLDETDR